VGVLLAELGCDVHVFERSPSELLGRGVGIVIHPITVRFLVERRGVDLDAISTKAAQWVYVAADGAVVYAEPCTYRFTAWNTLYRELRECLPADRYLLGRPLGGFDQSERCVRTDFGGGVSEADLLVGADGTHSTTRSLLLPAVVPRYSGYVGWRGTMPEAELSRGSREALDNAITYHLTGDSHILAYPIPSADGSVVVGDRLMNFVWYRSLLPGPLLDAVMTDHQGIRRDLSVPPAMVAEAQVAELHAAARRLPPAISELVTRIADPFVQQVMDVTVPRMAFGRVCLVGDAAFTARPHAAPGTAKAAAAPRSLAAASGGRPRGGATARRRTRRRTRAADRRSAVPPRRAPAAPAGARGRLDAAGAGARERRRVDRRGARAPRASGHRGHAEDRPRSAHHLALEVASVESSLELLRTNPYREHYAKPMEMKTGTNRKRQLNLFDPDGTRTELMEPVTVDGLPAPSSNAPPPTP